jgi:hypothetical protein
VAQPSFWKSLVPTFLRNTPETRTSPLPSHHYAAQKTYNPATFFIFIFLFIGSQAIQMIALRSEYRTFSRRAEAKMGLLREVIRRVQDGEDVDVEGLLGTGDEREEKEWEEVLKEIVAEDRLWQKQARKREAKERKDEEERLGNEAQRGREGESVLPVNSREEGGKKEILVKEFY